MTRKTKVIRQISAVLGISTSQDLENTDLLILIYVNNATGQVKRIQDCIVYQMR